jgi:hypothetical protein
MPTAKPLLRKMRLAGVELYFDDLEKAKQFCRDTLGLKMSSEAAGHHANSTPAPPSSASSAKARNPIPRATKRSSSLKCPTFALPSKPSAATASTDTNPISAAGELPGPSFTIPKATTCFFSKRPQSDQSASSAVSANDHAKLTGMRPSAKLLNRICTDEER